MVKLRSTNVFFLFIIFTFFTYIFRCGRLPDAPKWRYEDANISVSVESLTTDSSGIYQASFGDTIHFSFILETSILIDSFHIDLEKDTVLRFIISDTTPDTIKGNYIFTTVGEKSIYQTVYYNNVTEKRDSIKIIIMCGKPFFVKGKPDTVYEFSYGDSAFVTIIAFDPDSTHAHVSIIETNLPETVTLEFTDDTTLSVTLPENIAGNYSVTLQALNNDQSDSSTVTFSLKIDAIPPFPPVFLSSTISGSTIPTWRWESGGDGAGTYRYKLDNNDFSFGTTEIDSTSFTPVGSLSEGIHTFFVQERDSMGNWSAVASLTINIDLSPPSAPRITGSELTGSSTPTWSWRSGSGGNHSYRFKIDDDDFADGAIATKDSSYTSTEALDEGAHIFYLQEQDKAGNWSESTSFTTIVDLSPPSAPTVTGTPVSNSPRPIWSWTPGRNGIGSYRYKLDDDNLDTDATETIVCSFTPENNLPEGVHTLFVQESDAVGNWSQSGSFEITVDLTASGAPQVFGTSPTSSTTPTWSWQTGGGSGSYRYKLDDDNLSDGAIETGATTFTPAEALSEGNHTLFVQEDDGSGNWSSSGFFVIQVDLTAPSAPTLSGTTPTNHQRPTWNWLTVDGAGIFRYEPGNNDLSGSTETTVTSYTPDFDLSEGDLTFYLQERDAAGNWSEVISFTITVDCTPPLAPAITGTTPTNDPRPTWTWSSNNGNGIFRYKLDDDDFSEGATTTTETLYQPSSNLLAGTHTLYVQEQDDAENWSKSDSLNIVVDSTPGNAPIFSVIPLPTNNQTPTWKWSSGGGRGYYMYRLDDPYIEGDPGYTHSNSFTPSSKLSEGIHILYIKEQDDAENWSDSSSRGIKIDITPPGVPHFTSGTTKSPVDLGSITWTWSGGNGGNDQFRYKLNDSSWSSTNNTIYTQSNLGEGKHILYIKERDAAGNWSDSVSDTVYILPAPTKLTLKASLIPICVYISWQDNATSTDKYQIYYKRPGDTFKPLVLVSGSSYQHKGVLCGMYIYQVSTYLDDVGEVAGPAKQTCN